MNRVLKTQENRRRFKIPEAGDAGNEWKKQQQHPENEGELWRDEARLFYGEMASLKGYRHQFPLALHHPDFLHWNVQQT